MGVLGRQPPALQEGEEALSLCGFHTSRSLKWVLPASPAQGTPKSSPAPALEAPASGLPRPAQRPPAELGRVGED